MTLGLTLVHQIIDTNMQHQAPTLVRTFTTMKYYKFNVHTVHIRRIRRKNQQYADCTTPLFLRVGSYMFRQ
jgi:hypothetical protein